MKCIKKIALAAVSCICLLSVVQNTGYTAEKKAWNADVSFSVGLNEGGYNELAYSDCAQSVSAVSWNLQADVTKGSFLHKLKFLFYYDKPESVLSDTAVLNQDYDALSGEMYYVVSTTSVQAYRGAVEYGCFYTLWGGTQFPGSVGGVIRSDAFIQLAHYPVITAAVSFCPAVTQSWVPDEENRISCTLSVPVIGWALRPPYAGADGLMIEYAEKSPLKILGMGGFTSLHNYQCINFSVDWTHRVKSWLAVRAGADFYMSRFTEPEERRSVEINLRAGMECRFGRNRRR